MRGVGMKRWWSGTLVPLLLFMLAAASAAAQEAERVLLRVGEHAGFSRLVFDWEKPVDYAAAQADGRLVITFNRPAEIDLVDIKGALSRLSEPELQQQDGKLIVSFKLAAGAAVRDFRDQTKVVFDIADPVGGKEPPAAREKQTSPPQRPSVKSSAPAARLQAAEAQTPKAARPQAAEAQTPKVARPQAAETPTSTAARPSGAAVAVQFEPIFSGVRLSYPLAEPQPAAAFLRGGYLWVVFEKLQSVNHDGLKGALGERLKSADQLAHPLATVLRYRVGEGLGVTAHRRDATWIIDLKDHKAPPQLPIDVVPQDINGAAGVFLPVANVGSRLALRDPDIGDELMIAPVLAAGRGVADARRFAQFEIIPTAQGVAVEVLADGISVDRFQNGVAVSGAHGLKLSNLAAGQLEQPMAAADEAAAPRRLVDLAAWRRGGAADYAAVRHALLARLSQAKAEDRNSARWDLARFYLGHGLADQALGILTVMAATEPTLLDNAEFRAARGIAQVLMQRFTEARNDLAFTGLDAELDIYLWRGLAAQGLADWPAALAAFERGQDALADLNDAERARFHVALLQTAAQLKRNDIMETQLAVLSGLALPDALSAEVELIRAQMLADAGDAKTAQDALGKVVASGVRPAAARARLAKINLQLARQEVEAGAAIESLERLRYAWRGDDFELNLLDRLGRLYMQTGDYRTGLGTLRQAVTYFEKSSHTRRLSDIMTGAFRDLFLNGMADGMPPLQALSLYYDYRELTPLGTEGDQMIRRLADRLVSVDLLERAAELLEHQVRYRLEGVAQADVAARLAMIYLLDRKPEKALAVMRATRQTIMPEDVETRRRHLEARALVDLGRFEEAEVMLEADKSREAELLRADLYWGAERWDDVVKNAEVLLGRRWEEKRPLSNDERRQVLRLAVAQSLAENVAGLRSLRERYGGLMVDGAYTAAFDVVTAKEDPSINEIKELTESIASVNTLEGFMTAYRREFKGS